MGVSTLVRKERAGIDGRRPTFLSSAHLYLAIHYFYQSIRFFLMRLAARFLLVLMLAFAGCYSAGEVNEPPSVGFELSPQTPSAGTEVTFTAEATDPDPNGTIASFEWEFGDGDTASGRTVTHTYEEPGSYEVTVTVTDNRGATDDAQKTVEVQ